MTDQIEKAVERAISAMRADLGAELTVDDLARAALFSKFHFIRIFQRVTGVSPRRFLSALRLQQAKILLISTSLNVSDISCRVGYNSVGTFSSRFSRSVGMSPTVYRGLGGVTREVAVGEADDAHANGVVAGVVTSDAPGRLSDVYLGLFPGRIPEGRPAACVVHSGLGTFIMEKVPPGQWYLLAQGVVNDDEGNAPTRDGAWDAVGCRGPIEVLEDTVLDGVDIRLRPRRFLDPPVLMALPDARTVARPAGRGSDARRTAA